MANLITALQQKPSVSSTNYVAEFLHFNHHDMLGTGGERLSGRAHQRRDLDLVSKVLKTQMGFSGDGDKPGSFPYCTFSKLGFSSSLEWGLTLPLPDLCWFPDKFGLSQPQKINLYKPRVLWCWLNFPSCNVRPAEARRNWAFWVLCFPRRFLFHLTHHAHLGTVLQSYSSLVNYK